VSQIPTETRWRETSSSGTWHWDDGNGFQLLRHDLTLDRDRSRSAMEKTPAARTGSGSASLGFGRTEGVLSKYTNLIQGWQNRYRTLAEPEHMLVHAELYTDTVSYRITKTHSRRGTDCSLGLNRIFIIFVYYYVFFFKVLFFF